MSTTQIGILVVVLAGLFAGCGTTVVRDALTQGTWHGGMTTAGDLQFNDNGTVDFVSRERGTRRGGRLTFSPVVAYSPKIN